MSTRARFRWRIALGVLAWVLFLAACVATAGCAAADPPGTAPRLILMNPACVLVCIVRVQP